jgi:hypothetical protein
MVPVDKRAWAATSFLASALGRLSAVGAHLGAPVAEVLAVVLAVAGDAKRFTVGNVKAQFGVIGPCLDMVGMERPGGLTPLAGIPVPLVDRFPPLSKTWAKAGPVPFQGPSVFPATGQRSYPELAGAGLGTEDLFALVGDEGLETRRARSLVRGVAMFTAHSGAVASRSGTVDGHLERGTTHCAGFGESVLRRHASSIAHQTLEPKYVAVTLERLAGMGLEPKLTS